MKRISVLIMCAGWIILAVLTNGYTFHQATAEYQTTPQAIRVERIGVMSFLIGRCGSEIGDTLDCPVSHLYFNPDRLVRNSDRLLTTHVQEELRKRYGERVISIEKVTDVYGRISKDESKDTLRTLAKRLGEALETRFIVAGTVWRYEERGGGAVGSFSPASVAFAIYLIDVASGKMLWKRKFDETQRSLSENVLDTWAFLKKGAKWLSADELARYGVREVFKKFPL